MDSKVVATCWLQNAQTASGVYSYLLPEVSVTFETARLCPGPST